MKERTRMNREQEKESGGKSMNVTNPYYNRAMLPVDSDMFFGREKEMRFEKNGPGNEAVLDKPGSF